MYLKSRVEREDRLISRAMFKERVDLSQESRSKRGWVGLNWHLQREGGLVSKACSNRVDWS